MGLEHDTVTLAIVSIFLGWISVAVILGNSLVITAVLTYPKLRSSVNNSFIASLAAADFLLGVTVLPFAALLEGSGGRWTFGVEMCTLWLAMDVWMSTASIYHLCSISFDRYLAVAFPLKYPHLMSSTRCRILIVSTWAASFLVCFPPLVGWNGEDDAPFSDTNRTEVSPPSSEASNYTCDVVGANSPGYVVYSALGSFFLPSAVMTFFYLKVFQAARKYNNAVRAGVVGGTRTQAASCPPCSVLRVHRGKVVLKQDPPQPRVNAETSTVSLTRPRYCRLSDGPLSSSSRAARMKGVGSPKSQRYLGELRRLHNASGTSLVRAKTTTPGKSNLARNSAFYSSRRNAVPTSFAAMAARRGESGKATNAFAERTRERVANRNLLREAKAAKTLAIIVGAFIVCWLPFFIMYLLTGLCPSKDCVPDDIFRVFVWIGYCNSAINPIIYAVFSKDYRHAFKKLLRCQLKARKERRNGLMSFLASLYIQGSSSERDSVYSKGRTSSKSSDERQRGKDVACVESGPVAAEAAMTVHGSSAHENTHTHVLAYARTPTAP